MKFLIDECLSLSLVKIAQDQGYQATHVNWLGLSSKGDWTIVQRSVEDSYVIVTNNATDFKLLIGREEIHAGLVCLNIAPDLILAKAFLHQERGAEVDEQIVDPGHQFPHGHVRKGIGKDGDNGLHFFRL